MSISVTDMLYLGGVALVTGLAALLPVGLASRYSIIGVDEEAPPWVSQTWSGLHSLANGVFCTLAIELSLKVGTEQMSYLWLLPHSDPTWNSSSASPNLQVGPRCGYIFWQNHPAGHSATRPPGY